jgi:hypothetical protein
MRLMIAGINHDDVMGAVRLSKWLREVKTAEERAPAFVAVEYDKQIFRSIQAQRPTLRRLAAETWPTAPSSFLKTIEDSLAYEGDLHETIFPGADTIWLDQGRAVVDQTIISHYACDRMKNYRRFFPGDQQDFGKETLQHMSVKSWKEVSSPSVGGSPRDIEFARHILNHSRKVISGWAIVIVGVNHASEVEGSMISRLKNEGIECRVSELRPCHC